MKYRKAKKRLEARIAAYEAMRGSGGTDKKKIVDGSQFTRPGSLNK